MKREIFKRLSIILISFTMLFILCVIPSTASAQDSNITRSEILSAAQKTIDWYHTTYKGYEFKGLLDWPAVGLSGFGEDVSGEKWTTADGKNAAYWREQAIIEAGGLNPAVNTDYQRTIIGVCAAGKDPRDFAGLNLVEIEKNTMLPSGKFADSVEDNETGEPVGEELINAHIFGIISLYCAGEPIPNRDKALAWLEKQQLPDGGYVYYVPEFEDPEDYNLIDGDVDMTAGALMALAILGEDESNPTVKKALDFLRDKQLENGGFSSWGTTNPESCTWAIVALTLLGQDPIGEKWTKEDGKNPVTALLEFQLKDGTFTHVLSNGGSHRVASNAMSTYQALYGLASAYNNKSVYEMLHDKYRPKAEVDLFNDYTPNDFGFKETMDLIYDYVISGYNDGSFRPENPVTRAEFTKYLVEGLKVGNETTNTNGSEIFSDVSSASWADEYIGICADIGWIEGTTKTTYQPNKSISGEQLMIILVRAAGLKEEAEALNTKGESWSDGYIQIAKENGFIYEGFDAKKPATRAECSWSVSQLRDLLGVN